jgi:hypothetical protein
MAQCSATTQAARHWLPVAMSTDAQHAQNAKRLSQNRCSRHAHPPPENHGFSFSPQLRYLDSGVPLLSIRYLC